jgi:hypothetical protein
VALPPSASVTESYTTVLTEGGVLSQVIERLVVSVWVTYPAFVARTKPSDSRCQGREKSVPTVNAVR